METWMPIFVGVIALAVVVQTIMLIVIGVVVMKLGVQMKANRRRHTWAHQPDPFARSIHRGGIAAAHHGRDRRRGGDDSHGQGPGATR